MRLGLFGGSFDPVHIGHLILAEQCREQLALDEVWFIPAATPPHKQNRTLAPAKARVDMLDFALAGHAQFQVSDIELDRPGPSYTVDTLSALHAEDPSRELFFLIGADSLWDFHSWREPEEIAKLATIVAVNRGDNPLPDRGQLAERLSDSILDRIQFVEMPGVFISATDLRQRVAAGKSIRFMTPRAVETYIHTNQLYAAAE